MCKNKESNKQMEKTVNLNVNAAYEAKSKTPFLRLAIHLWWIHIYAVFLLGFSLTEYTRSLVISPSSSTALFYFSFFSLFYFSFLSLSPGCWPSKRTSRIFCPFPFCFLPPFFSRAPRAASLSHRRRTDNAEPGRDDLSRCKIHQYSILA